MVIHGGQRVNGVKIASGLWQVVLTLCIYQTSFDNNISDENNLVNKVVKGSSDGSTENSDSSTKSSGLTTLSCHPKPMAVSTVTSICLGAWNDTFHSYNCSFNN